MTMVTVWPGATAKEMEEQVAEKLEKRMQQSAGTTGPRRSTRPGLAFTTVNPLDTTPPVEVPEQFYQARKKLGDEAHNLPPGVIGPIVNDEYSDVTFALYALKANGEPHRVLVRDAEVLRERLLHVPGVKKSAASSANKRRRSSSSSPPTASRHWAYPHERSLRRSTIGTS